MNIACSNKLLKLIEEPPVNTIFLLISEDSESVLPTIRSRCQPLNIRSIEKEEMVAALSLNFELSDDEANSIAHVANGNYTAALHMIESSEDNRFLFQLFVNMMRASVSGNIKSIKETANEIAGIGREMQKSFISYSLKMFREYFVTNLGESEMVYLNDYEEQFGERFSPFINEKNIEQFNDEFSLAYRQIEQNGNAKIVFLELCLRATILLRK
jgi:DNA polymerase-3 subunit delta'